MLWIYPESLCSLREHHRTSFRSDVCKGPVFCRVLDPTKSWVPRNLESHEVLDPTKSWIPRSPESHEVLDPTKSWIPRSPWSSSGGCRVLWSCTSGVPSPYIGGPILVYRGSSPGTLGVQSSYVGVDPMASGLWRLECPSGWQACVHHGQDCPENCLFIFSIGNRS